MENLQPMKRLHIPVYYKPYLRLQDLRQVRKYDVLIFREIDEREKEKIKVECFRRGIILTQKYE